MNTNQPRMNYTFCAEVDGLNVKIIKVEVHTKRGLPRFHIVGMAMTSVKESAERVRAAIENSHYDFPMQNILVNLSPAGLKKDSSWFDLSIALAILNLTDQIDFPENINSFLILGELGLDGHVKPMKGLLNILSSLKKSDFENIIIPKENQFESFLSNKNIFPITHLNEVNDIFNNKINPFKINISKHNNSNSIPNIELYPTQLLAMRKMTIALAGKHHSLLIGSPGNGKSMISNLAQSLTPSLSDNEYEEVLKIKSLQDYFKSENDFQIQRPFRTPHHTASDISITGGGKFLTPGEVTLSHRGILFLDELCEFRSSVIQSLREPMEEGCITLSRVNYHVTYPASFLLICATNPCPCGFFFSSTRACICSEEKIRKYLLKISGPFLDRIDIQIILEPPPTEKKEKILLDLTKLKTQISNAFDIQKNRYKLKGFYFNGELKENIEKQIYLKDNVTPILESIKNYKNITLRKYYKILKLSRTIADLDNKEQIEEDHIYEAVQINKLLITEYLQK
jgi:magnesium chelatase family protein